MPIIKALSLDLDDTLWPIWPIIERAETALHEFLLVHAPATAAQFPIPAMRHVREQIAQAHPELAHDFTAHRPAMFFGQSHRRPPWRQAHRG